MGTLTNNNIRSGDVAMRFFTAGQNEILTNTLDFTISEQATEGVDSLCGTTRDDPYTVTNFFDIAYNGTQLDTSLLDELLANIANKDANQGENPAVCTLTITTKKGVGKVYAFSGVTRKAWTMSASGRSDPWKMGHGFKCKHFDPVP
jgi:hypothetical protein